MILLSAPTEAELYHVRRALQQARHHSLGGQRVTEGLFNQREVVAATTGVGKVMAAAVTSALISHYRPEAMLLGGIGGGLDPQLPPGTAVIGTEYLQWDFDASPAGLSPGTVPHARRGTQGKDKAAKGTQKKGRAGLAGWLEADKALLQIVQKAAEFPREMRSGNMISLPGTGYRKGRLITGDTLVADVSEKQRLGERFFADAIDMESYAAACAAYIAEVPFIALRYIFDAADGARAADIRRFTDLVSLDLQRLWGNAVQLPVPGPGSG